MLDVDGVALRIAQIDELGEIIENRRGGIDCVLADGDSGEQADETFADRAHVVLRARIESDGA